MSPDIRPPDLDEPAVRSPELRRLVAAARAAPDPVLRVTPEAVFAGYEAAHRARRRLGLGLGLAAAAVLALVSLRPWSLLQKTGPTDPVVAHMSTPTPTTALAEPVRVTATEGPAPAVRGPWELELAPGRYEIAVAEHPGGELLRVDTPAGAIEVAHGLVAVVVAGTRTEAALRAGVASWIAPDGARTPLALQELQDRSEKTPTPAELARRADELLGAGRADAAIDVLGRLVTAHPDSSPARAALLDLARLLRAEGRTDEARCAYALYLERYPAKEQLAEEVEAALARLGPGRACAGLRPR